MYETDYKWHHDYPRLAFDTGFQFGKLKSENFDKNKICSVDINRLIEERDFAAIEKLIPSVIKFVLDPEQTKLLDESFVKIFHLSQLSIQYLLYCKNYLDKSLTILKNDNKKLKEETTELNLFVEDLKNHISTLMKEIEEKPTFRCLHCNKIFSTEDFLNSHIKRRHTSPEIETEKLEMEIKELKGRLNNAEKMIQKEQHEIDTNISKENDLKKIEDLQQKFEELRIQVQSELKILQTQNNFQEKYEKLIEKIALDGGKSGGGLVYRRESTTQTEFDRGDFRDVDKIQEDKPEEKQTERQIEQFGEALESKVTSSLEKIENQMQSFWKKLNEMERYKAKGCDNESEKQKPKPMIRSRSKSLLQNPESSPVQNLTLKVSETDESSQDLQISENLEKTQPVRIVAAQFKSESVETQEVIKSKPEITKTSPVKPQTAEKPKQIQIQADDTTTSETIASESEMTESTPKPVPQKRPQSSFISKNVIDEELLKHFRFEIEKIILGRLQDLGVSPDWKGLPNRSFQRAIEIVQHQANLIKKTHPNFDYISAQIESTISRKIQQTNSPKSPKKPKLKKIEIKNRKMYETDSDDEIKPHQISKTVKQFSTPYSAVIEELKIKTSENQKNEETKGVLKSFPSVGSLTKKKVLFNLKSNEENKKDNGSSTSIASSVFDATPRQEEKKPNKDIEDLSDFDFSEM